MNTKYAQEFVAELYRLALHRAPDEGGLHYFQTALTSGRLSREQAAREIMESAEYAALHRPGNQSVIPESLPRVCFLHIEKTAGSSFHEYLTEVYGPANIFPERLRYLERYTADDFLACSVYSGHYTFGNCWRLPIGTRFGTMLREPRSRVISCYYFWRSLSIEVDNIAAGVARNCRNIEEFLTHPDTQFAIRDIQVSSLLPAGGSGAEDACRALDRFAFVGIQEQYCLSVLMMAEKMGWPLPSQIHRQMVTSEMHRHPNHQRRVEREPMTDRVRELLDRCTEQDRILYDYAVSRFEQQVQGMFLNSAALMVAV